MIKINKQSNKRWLVLTFCIVSLFCTLLYGNSITTAYAMELTGDEYDNVFLENATELAIDNYGKDIDLVANKELVYDIALDKLGYLYDFSVNGENGYAIVINTRGTFEVAEIFFKSENPYKGIYLDKRIYIGNLVYLYNYDNEIYETKSRLLLDDNSISKLINVAHYSGNSSFTYQNETIYFTNRSEDSKKLALRYPYLIDVSSLSNECAAIAGANIIQYSDRYQTNLIPNYTPGRPLASHYIYSGPSAATNGLITDLYYDMGTNTGSAGTTINEFKTGLSKYAKGKGYNISFYSCMSNGTLNYSALKSKIDLGQPLAIFVDTFNIIEIAPTTGQDNINYILDNSTHVMAGFGYKDVTYTLNNGGLRNDKYINIASGLEAKDSGYLNINYNVGIDEVYSIIIN